MKITQLIFLLCFIISISSCVEAERKKIPKSTGQLVFEKYNCKSCHTIGRGKLIGPDLKGVTNKREKEWLEKWIRNPQELIESGDTIAINIYNEYDQSPMLPNDVSEIEMEELILYLSEKK